MTEGVNLTLGQFLCRRYDGPASSEALAQRIRVDAPGLQGGSSRFFSVCLATSDSPGSLRLVLDGIPFNAEVEHAAKEMGGFWTDIRGIRKLTVSFHEKSHPKLRKLGQAVRNVVGRGKSYVNPNWKWMAPAIAQAVIDLADSVREYRRTLTA